MRFEGGGAVVLSDDTGNLNERNLRTVDGVNNK